VSERIVIADARIGVGGALDRLEARCRAAGLPEPAVLEVRLVAEEVLTNIAKYAFEPEATPAAELTFAIADDAVVLEFRDRGRAFDPLARPVSGLDVPLEQRPVGGLGLALVRALADEVRYVREGPTNVLRVVKRREAR
jgi:sigma-B regulation protein RsbU (phosphoserine phosphatase)